MPYDRNVMLDLVLFGAGLAAWTLLEYVIHGWLGHQLDTFVGRMHDVHHRDPHAVFAVGAWAPTLAVLLLGLWRLGWSPTMVFYAGLASGFAGYELLHYRIHFRAPACRLEAALRARHLAHHHDAPDACFGVTTRFWDVVFGSEPDAQEMRRLVAGVAAVAPLEGRSNLGRILHLGIPPH